MCIRSRRVAVRSCAFVMAGCALDRTPPARIPGPRVMAGRSGDADGLQPRAGADPARTVAADLWRGRATPRSMPTQSRQRLAAILAEVAATCDAATEAYTLETLASAFVDVANSSWRMRCVSWRCATARMRRSSRSSVRWCSGSTRLRDCRAARHRRDPAASVVRRALGIRYRTRQSRHDRTAHRRAAARTGAGAEPRGDRGRRRDSGRRVLERQGVAGAAIATTLRAALRLPNSDTALEVRWDAPRRDARRVRGVPRETLRAQAGGRSARRLGHRRRSPPSTRSRIRDRHCWTWPRPTCGSPQGGERSQRASRPPSGTATLRAGARLRARGSASRRDAAGPGPRRRDGSDDLDRRRLVGPRRRERACSCCVVSARNDVRAPSPGRRSATRDASRSSTASSCTSPSRWARCSSATASSVNIKERRDFSCAIFDADAASSPTRRTCPCTSARWARASRAVVDALRRTSCAAATPTSSTHRMPAARTSPT